jgi:hypothetical protein
MSRTDIELRRVAAAIHPLGGLTGNEQTAIHDIYNYFASKGGGVASSAIITSPMCGTKHGRKTRLKRAKQIRASHVAELQAVGLLPIGTLFWLWWSSPIGWRFLLNWIIEILNETEEPAAAGTPLSTPEKGQT